MSFGIPPRSEYMKPKMAPIDDVEPNNWSLDQFSSRRWPGGALLRDEHAECVRAVLLDNKILEGAAGQNCRLLLRMEKTHFLRFHTMG